MSALRTLHQQISHLSAGTVRSAIPMPRPVEVLPRPDLATELMLFRPLALGDRSVFLEALNRSRDALRAWIPLAGQQQTDDAYFGALVSKGVAGDADKSAWRRAAFLNDGRFVGMFNIIKIGRGLSWSGELNWWVDSGMSGEGLGTHAIRAMVDHAMGDVPIGFGLHTLRANVCPENTASMRVAQKLGFRSTGEHDRLEINGSLVDHELLICDAIT